MALKEQVARVACRVPSGRLWIVQSGSGRVFGDRLLPTLWAWKQLQPVDSLIQLELLFLLTEMLESLIQRLMEWTGSNPRVALRSILAVDRYLFLELEQILWTLVQILLSHVHIPFGSVQMTRYLHYWKYIKNVHTCDYSKRGWRDPVFANSHFSRRTARQWHRFYRGLSYTFTNSKPATGQCVSWYK